MQQFRFDLHDLPPEAEALRQDVRAFLRENLAGYPAVRRSESWSGEDAGFSRKMGEAGFIGMTFPKKYGGHERSALERYVMLEEMLAAGAPVSHHWVADRQSGPLILRYGTEAQREKIIPGICRGEISFCIGMSEPDSGSDLASVRTKAEKVDGGYKVTGTKIWTSGAQRSDYMIALFRTKGEASDRHEGLSQFLVDVKSTKNITIRPIQQITGEPHFNQIYFDGAFVPEDMLVGKEHQGWKQVMAELAFERSGPERYMSSIQLLLLAIDEAKKSPDSKVRAGVGRLIAHFNTLRQMSVSVAAMLNAGVDPALEGSVVKELGALFEQELPDTAQSLFEAEPTVGDGSDFQQVLAYLTQISVSFSLRGGTREILRGIIARGLGLR